MSKQLRKSIIIFMTLALVVLGGAAIFIGLQLQQQSTSPEDTNAACTPGTMICNGDSGQTYCPGQDSTWGIRCGSNGQWDYASCTKRDACAPRVSVGQACNTLRRFSCGENGQGEFVGCNAAATAQNCFCRQPGVNYTPGDGTRCDGNSPGGNNGYSGTVYCQNEILDGLGRPDSCGARVNSSGPSPTPPTITPTTGVCRCTGGFTCTGVSINPDTTYCGMTTCGRDFQNYTCSQNGWVATGVSCSCGTTQYCCADPQGSGNCVSYLNGIRPANCSGTAVFDNSQCSEQCGTPITTIPPTTIPQTTIPPTTIPPTTIPPTTIPPTTVPPTISPSPSPTLTPTITTTTVNTPTPSPTTSPSPSGNTPSPTSLIPTPSGLTPTPTLPPTALVSDSIDRILFGLVMILFSIWFIYSGYYVRMGGVIWNFADNLLAKVSPVYRDTTYTGRVLKGRNKIRKKTKYS